MIYSPNQQAAISAITNFMKNPEESIFILKGAAGTGKTTLIYELINMCRQYNIVVQLMASTGRAAKVLSEKTNSLCTTVHLGIYNFGTIISKEIDNENVSKKSYHYWFPISDHNKPDLIIIDEASMISDVKSGNELFSFGTDRLLSDILTYANVSAAGEGDKKDSVNVKIIFVGDVAQLPPVGAQESIALDMNFFRSRGIKADEFELTTIHRQQESSGILKNATTIRELLKKPISERHFLSFEYGSQVDEIENIKLVDTYLNLFSKPSIDNGVIITYTNAQAFSYNVDVRLQYFPDQQDICVGDVVMIQNNNYFAYDVPIFNGDLAMVVYVNSNVISRSIPVWENKSKVNVDLDFREVKLKLKGQKEFSCLILDSFLNSPQRGLTTVEARALYIDFCIRNGKQKTVNKEGSEEFINSLRQDPYFNAVRIKYGYAITCHKSQGGEWETVFVNYSSRVGLSNDTLRWCYTATTRAKEQLYVVNPPHINCFTKFEFNEIKQVKGPSDCIYQENKHLITPYHLGNDSTALKIKYLNIEKKLKNTAYEIDKVERLQYCERYIIKNKLRKYIIDFRYNKNGVFNLLQGKEHMDSSELELIQLLNEADEYYPLIRYNPTTMFFTALYTEMRLSCENLNIEITNIVEHTESYYVAYYLKTSRLFSYIHFFYNSKGFFTKGMPMSDIGDKDDKLRELINQLKLI